MTDKIRILHCAESSAAFSGFGLYSRELFKRLSKNPRFELAELACFSTVNDNKSKYAQEHSWRYYPNAVDHNDPRIQEYNSNPHNVHGSWRFETICLDFKPDIVLDVRDPWNMMFQYKSPFRNNYHWVVSPTVDSFPQQDEWIHMFRSADAVFTYSDFGQRVLRKQCPDIKLQRAIYCGVDLEIFKPMNKSEIRKKFDLPEDAFVIGTVMRNQVRKLFPALFEMFAKLVKAQKGTPLENKLYLCIHTSYPDISGWDIPELIKENGISNNVLISYICHDTKKPFIRKYQGVKTQSPYTGNINGRFPNVGNGLDSKDLAEIYNVFDLYIQYASNEGCGIPMLEAASCGVPCAAPNYSSMEDNIELTDGIPLSHTLSYSIDTKANRAVPIIDKNVIEITKYLQKSDKYKKDKSIKARAAAEKYFNWDINANVWSDYFESVALKDRKQTWDSPIQKTVSPVSPIENLSNVDYVRWAAQMGGSPETASNIIGLNHIKMLNDGGKMTGGTFQQAGRDEILKDFEIMKSNIENCEQARLRGFQHGLDYIDFANMTKE